jgi:hypothetical protein
MDAKIVTKIAVLYLLYGEIRLRKLFLSRNLHGRYPKVDKFQNSEYNFGFLDPKIVTKGAIRCILG